MVKVWRRVWGGLLVVLLGAGAWAAETQVVYFGGHAASSAQMSCWVDGARASAWGRAGVRFSAVAYPIASPNPAAAVSSDAGRAAVQRIVDEIDRGPRDRVYVIAGHSSGGALANRVAELVKNPRQVRLVILDGSRPSEAAKKRVASTTCYVPSGTRPFNGGSMASCGSTKSIAADHCRGNATCGHFALVNDQVMPNLVSYRNDGYRRRDGRPGCAPHLSWVGPVPSAGTRDASPTTTDAIR